jgi:foldase protein PrsA
VSPGSKGNPAAQGTKKGPSAAEVAAERTRRGRLVGLVLFGALLIALFAIVAVAQGIGHEKPGDDEIAVVEDAPDGTITKEDFDRGLVQTAGRNGLKEVPASDSPEYEQLKQATISDLILSRWVLGEAEERGIEVSEREVDTELQRVIEEEFGSQKAFDKFLKQSGFTLEEALERVKLQLISQRIQEAVLPAEPSVSDEEVESYYEDNSSQFEVPETRDVRVVLAKTEADAEKALSELQQDLSPKSWEKVAKKYSIDEATKSAGGLRERVAEGESEPALDEQIFSAPQGQLVGPFKTDAGYYVIEVETINPAETTPLEEVSEDIRRTLAAAKQSAIAERFQQDFTAKWQARTYCADGYRIDRCANSEPTPSACTEKVAEETGCAAAVPSRAVIAPGTATGPGTQPTPALPQGPVFPKPPAAATIPGVEGLPPGVAPPGGTAVPPGG